MSGELVEQVARAICKARGRNPDDCVMGSGFISQDRNGVVTSGMDCSRYAWQDELSSAHAALATALSAQEAEIKRLNDRVVAESAATDSAQRRAMRAEAEIERLRAVLNGIGQGDYMDPAYVARAALKDEG